LQNIVKGSNEMAERRIVFLMYHELEESARRLCNNDPGYVRYVLRADDFRSQMGLLKQNGWRGVCVSEAIRFADDKIVAITFDDGSETDLLIAAPLLRQFGFGATFYITSGRLGQHGYLHQGQLRELSSLGFEIGCHSMTHAYLTDLDEAGMHREIVEAKSQLEQIVGKAVEHFSCPGGRFDWRVAKIAREAGYQSVATSEIHANQKSTDRFALGRVAIMRSTTLDEFGKIYSDRGLWRSQMSLQARTVGKKILGNSLYDRLRKTLLGHSSA
jgi:peptidoglycan/xylan/chitin deacetylase (PgdA/CDA1 family)